MLILIKLFLFILIALYPYLRMHQSFKKKEKLQYPKGKKDTKKVVDICYSLFIYGLLMLGIYINRSGLEAGNPLVIFEMNGMSANGYASLANAHIFSGVALLTMGMLSFWIVRIYSKALSPIIYVLCSTLIISNIIFAGIYLTHTGFLHDGEVYSIILLQSSFLSLCFLYIAGLKDSLNQFIDSQEKEIAYNNKLLSFLYKASYGYQKMPRLWAISLFPIMVII